MPRISPKYKLAPLDASSWIVKFVSFSSIILFALLAMAALPSAFGLSNALTNSREIPAVPLFLSIALVLLAWRRSVELKRVNIERARAAEREYHLSFKDDVTGLFNRRFLVEKLDSAVSEARLTLLALDLDHFKRVNDLYGHAAGDQLLLELSNRMQNTFPKCAICARLGGDEFAILLSGNSAEPGEALVLAGNLIEALNKEIQLDGSVATIGVSIGLSTMEPGQGEAVSLLRRSDIAMYEAKRLGRNCSVWFDSEMEDKLNKRNSTESEMRVGIIEGQFIPFFQPVLNLSSSEVKGFEVLARWDHPIKGIIEPDDFISVAEATGMISDLSFAVMRTAFLRAINWPSDVTIACNVSPVQFKDPLLAQRIIKLLNETGFPAQRLELEITESAILEDRGLALLTIESLKNFGIRISLDDFGTGFASLSQLRELPFDRVKIDKSFVASILDDSQSNAIVQSIASLCGVLKLPITAEGVETEIVRIRLQELGCSDAQGWLFGKAVPGQEADETFFGMPPQGLPKQETEIITPPSQDRRDYLRRGIG